MVIEVANITFCQQYANSMGPSSRGLKIWALINLIVALFVYPTGIVYFVKNRNFYFELKSRNLFLVATTHLGALLLLIGSSIRALIGAEEFSCSALLLILNIQFIFIFHSSFVRVYSLYWRVKFNQKLILKAYSKLVGGNLRLGLGSVRFISKKSRQNFYYEEVFVSPRTKSGNLWMFSCIQNKLGALLFCICFWKPCQNIPSELQLAQFLASTYFANITGIILILCPTVLVSALVLINIPLNQSCLGCSVDSFLARPLMSLSVIFLITALYLWAMFDLRKVSDSLGLKRELLIGGFTYLSLLFGIIAPMIYWTKDLQEDGRFHVALIPSSAAIFFFLYLVPYQVYRAKQLKKDLMNSDSTLKEVLKYAEGRKAFCLYLVSNLTLENLLFYEEVEEWTMQFAEFNEEERNIIARHLYEKFLGQDAFLLVNISSLARETILTALDNPSLNMFDIASREIFQLMSTDIYPRFIESRYYRAYLNQLENAKTLSL